MNNNSNKINQGRNNNPYKLPNAGLGLWKIFLAFFLMWIIAFYFMKYLEGPSKADIPYSKFENELSGKNVVKITIQGDKISVESQNKYIKVNKPGDKTAFQYFSTIKPSIHDPNLMPSLEKNNVTINAKEESNNGWISDFIFIVLPFVGIVGYFIYMRRKMQGKEGGIMGGFIFNIGRSTAQKFKKGKSGVTFNDVPELRNAEKDLQEILDYLRVTGKFSALIANILKGILLMGPPGIRKTLLACAAAGEANVTFYSISGSEFKDLALFFIIPVIDTISDRKEYSTQNLRWGIREHFLVIAINNYWSGESNRKGNLS